MGSNSTTPLPCPFCGDVDSSIVEKGPVGWSAWACDNCGAHGPEVYRKRIGEGSPLDLEEELLVRCIEAWNKRQCSA